MSEEQEIHSQEHRVTDPFRDFEAMIQASIFLSVPFAIFGIFYIFMEGTVPIPVVLSVALCCTGSGTLILVLAGVKSATSVYEKSPNMHEVEPVE